MIIPTTAIDLIALHAGINNRLHIPLTLLIGHIKSVIVHSYIVHKDEVIQDAYQYYIDLSHSVISHARSLLILYLK